MSPSYKERSALQIETVSFLIEAVAGIAVIVLAIIGLAHAEAGFIASITGIVLGAAWLAQGATTAGEYSRLLPMASQGTLGAVELGGGMTAEIVAGGTAVVLGILGVLGFRPEILMPIAIMVVGTSVILAAGGFERLNTLRVEVTGLSELGERVAKGAVGTAIAVEMLAGVSAVVLGILALTLSPAYAATLTLVGLLVLGVGLTINGTALTGRLFRLFNVVQRSPASPQAAE